MRSYHSYHVTALGSLALLMTGCAAVQTSISHADLDVQSKMTNTVFLDPVTPDRKVIFLQVRNSSDRPEIDITPDVRQALATKGYTLVADPDQANYQLQVNVLQVGKASPSAAEQANVGGYGSVLNTAYSGSYIGSTFGGYNATAAGGLVAGAIATLADAAVKNVTFSIVTDLQISERSIAPVTEQTVQSLEQGRAGRRNVTTQEVSSWKRYQTRIVRPANEVNLDFAAAVPTLRGGMARSITGMF